MNAQTQAQNPKQAQTKPNTIIFVERTVEWDGYELIDDQYTVMQPVLLIHCNPWGKYKRLIINQKYGLTYVDLRVPKEVFRELLRAGAVKNVGANITAWDWNPLKAIPILQKHGYVVNQGWYKQYLANEEANKKAMEKVKEYEKQYGKHSYGIKNGILWYRKPQGGLIVYNAHTNETIETDDYSIRDRLVDKYDPLNYVSK